MHLPSWSVVTTLVSAPDQAVAGPRSRDLTVVGSARLRKRSRPALVLGLFFLCLYLLTMGGHLDSPDEELMFQVTRSLAERGSMEIGRASCREECRSRWSPYH